MRCPIEKSNLTRRSYEADIEVDECPRCHSIWLDVGEIERIQETLRNDYSDELKKIPDLISQAYEMARAKLKKNRDCPNCGGDG